MLGTELKTGELLWMEVGDELRDKGIQLKTDSEMPKCGHAPAMSMRRAGQPQVGACVSQVGSAVAQRERRGGGDSVEAEGCGRLWQICEQRIMRLLLLYKKITLRFLYLITPERDEEYLFLKCWSRYNLILST